MWLTINDVRWKMIYASNENHPSHIHHLDTNDSFNPLDAFKLFHLEAFIPNTPYLAFRVGKKYKDRGRLTWYSLETVKPVDGDVIKPHMCRVQALR